MNGSTLVCMSLLLPSLTTGCSGDDKGADSSPCPFDTPLPVGFSRVAYSCVYTHGAWKPADEWVTFTIESSMTSVSDDTIPPSMTISVRDENDFATVLFEDTVMLDPPAQRATIDNPGQGLAWSGLFEPQDPVDLPAGEWVLELNHKDVMLCDNTTSLSLVYERPPSDCDTGNPTTSGLTTSKTPSSTKKP